MVIIGLLLIALVCLVVGLILQSAVWLVASLIATAGAGFLLYKLRDVIAPPAQTGPSEAFFADEARADAPTASQASNGASPTEQAVGVRSEAGPDDVAAAPAASADDQVWVIDGRPRYHVGDCAIIKGQDAEAVPFEQAVEDGFLPCSLCEPQAARTR